MKKSSHIFLGSIVFMATAAILVFSLAFWWASQEFQSPGTFDDTKMIEIERGSGLDGIAWKLKEAGAVENPYIFVFGTRLLGAQADLKAGEYEITPRMSPRDIMWMIKDGKVFARRITVPEGLTSFETVGIVNTNADLEGEVTAIPPEGTLLPQTYDYRLKDNKQDIISRMQGEMTKAIDELWDGRAQNLPFTTKEEAITLASIVEKETGIAGERQRVAGVFINRLRAGIALQTDPTVIYAITGGKPKSDGKGPLGRRLLSKDMQFESPYNTYLHPGLPPGPIANPGRASIEAVLHPEEHKFLYFVADGTGGHIFAETLAQHEKNVAEWRKIRREQTKN